LRSRSIPPDTWASDSMPPPRPIDAPCPPEGPVNESGPVGHVLMLAERPEVGDPFMASFGQSGASLRALLPDSPQEIRDTRAQEDTAQVPDPEAEAYANVGASISLPDLAVGAAANVGAPTSPPDLEAVATTNVGATLGLGQTTRHTQSSKSSIGMGRAFGDESAPVTHGFPYRCPNFGITRSNGHSDKNLHLGSFTSAHRGACRHLFKCWWAATVGSMNGDDSSILVIG